MLTTIMIGKLPNDIRKNLATDHSNIEWTLDDLRSSIIKEILGTGIHSSKSNHTDTTSITMTSLYTGCTPTSHSRLEEAHSAQANAFTFTGF